jgi:hypothetical protein
LHQLLGLRLRFCLRGKYSDIFNFIFQINSVDLFGQCLQKQLVQAVVVNGNNTRKSVKRKLQNNSTN